MPGLVFSGDRFERLERHAFAVHLVKEVNQAGGQVDDIGPRQASMTSGAAAVPFDSGVSRRAARKVPAMVAASRTQPATSENASTPKPALIPKRSTP